MPNFRLQCGDVDSLSLAMDCIQSARNVGLGWRVEVEGSNLPDKMTRAG